MASSSVRPFSTSVSEDNRDSVMAAILHLLRRQQNPQPTVISTGSVDVPGTVKAILLLAETIAGARFRCRTLHPSISPMAMSNTCSVISAPIMSASGDPAMTWLIEGAVRTSVGAGLGQGPKPGPETTL